MALCLHIQNTHQAGMRGGQSLIMQLSWQLIGIEVNVQGARDRLLALGLHERAQRAFAAPGARRGGRRGSCSRSALQRGQAHVRRPS